MAPPPVPGPVPRLARSSSRRDGNSSFYEDLSPAFSAAAAIAAAASDGWNGADDGGGAGGGDGAGGGKFLAAILASTAKAMAMAASSERVTEPVLGLGTRPFPGRFESFARERDGGEGGRVEDAAALSGGGAAAGLSGGAEKLRSKHHH